MPANVKELAAQVESELRFRRECESLEFTRPTDAEARRHLLSFLLHGFEHYRAGWVHTLICERLEQFVADLDAGREPRLILTMPPRHGKSEIVSRRLPIWFMGTHPGASVGVAAYGQDLADDMSRDARRIRDASLGLFPHLGVDPAGVDRASRWDTKGGGSYLAAGIGGPLTGRGFDLGIVDDPVKNMAAADSQAERDAAWEWYLSTFYTRRSPRAGLLVMATRWHEDDLIGRLMAAEKEGGDRWEVLEFPALAEKDEHHPRTGRLLRREGEALHAERYPVENLQKTRASVSARVWSALYQCRPTSKQGRLFRRAWYADRYTFDPQRPPMPWSEIVVSVDCNFKKTDDSAYASIGVWARWDGEVGYYRVDEFRERFTYPELRTKMFHVKQKWRPNCILIEEAANGHALIADLRTVIPSVIAFKPIEYGSKEARAEVASPTHEAGGIRLPAGELWADEWIEEHVDFPVGKFKDRVDESSQLVIYWTSRSHKATTADVNRATAAMLSIFGR